jgi:hypothetical protein
MKKWGIVLGVFIIIIFIYQFKQLKDIKKDLETSLMDDQLIKESITTIDENITSTISEELSKSYLIKDIKFILNRFENSKYIVDTRFELSKINKGSNVKFIYKSDDSDKWNIMKPEDMKGLSYKCELELDSNKSYEYKVITEGSISESSDIEDINKYDYIPYHPPITYGEDYEKHGGSLILGVNIDEEYNYEDEYGYSTVDKKETIKGFEIKRIDATLGINGKEKVYNYEYKDIVNDENGNIIESRRYEVYIPKKDYKGKLDYIKMKIVYENGVVDIVDITNQIEEKYIN